MQMLHVTYEETCRDARETPPTPALVRPFPMRLAHRLLSGSGRLPFPFVILTSCAQAKIKPPRPLCCCVW